MKMPKFDLTNLKTQVQDQPLIAAGVGAALLSGGAKFINAVSTNRNSKTWKKEVNRRTKTSNKK